MASPRQSPRSYWLQSAPLALSSRPDLHWQRVGLTLAKYGTNSSDVRHNKLKFDKTYASSICHFAASALEIDHTNKHNNTQINMSSRLNEVKHRKIIKVSTFFEIHSPSLFNFRYSRRSMKAVMAARLGSENKMKAEPPGPRTTPD